MKLNSILLSFLFFSLFTFNTYSQKEKMAGIIGAINLTSNFDTYSLVGLSYESRSNHFIGLETGFFLKKYAFTDISLNISYASIPLYLKIYSNFLNLSLGVNLDVLSEVKSFSWEFSSSDLTDFFPILIGGNVKISRDFIINHKYSIEPTTSFNINSNFISFDFGFGIKLKYRFIE